MNIWDGMKSLNPSTDSGGGDSTTSQASSESNRPESTDNSSSSGLYSVARRAFRSIGRSQTSQSVPASAPATTSSTTGRILGHREAVTTVAFSPDGLTFASGSKDRTIRIWSSKTGRPEGQPMKGHANEVTCIAFSPDGTSIASSSYDKTLRIWDVESRQTSHGPFTGHTDWITSLAYSPDGHCLVSGSRDRSIRVWDTRTGFMLRTLQGHSNIVTSVAYSKDGKFVASASEDMTIAIWDAHSGQKLGDPCGHEKRVTSVAFSPNSKFVVSASVDGKICVWEAKTGLLVSQRGDDPGPVLSIAFSPDGRYFASGSFDRIVRIRDAESGRLVFGPFHGHNAQINSVAFSPDSKIVISGSQDYTIRMWKLMTPEETSGGNAGIEPPSVGEPEPSFKAHEPVLSLDELWAMVYRQSTLRPLSENVIETSELPMRDWSGFITKGHRIGGGGFGDVYLGKWVNVPNLTVRQPPRVVVKMMRKFMKDAIDRDRAKSMKREVEVWLRLRHSNTVPFVGVAYDLDGEGGDTSCPAMISLWMANGNLKEYLQWNPTLLRAPLLLQIAQGLSYLHHFETEIVHGDLKSENVFVDKDGTLRIGDFGLSRMLNDESLWLTSATQAAGTVRWMAPELLDGRQPTVTKESDVYAFGMTALEIFTGQVPFHEYANDGQVITAVVTRKELPSRPSGVKDWIWTLLNNCWSTEASQRLKIADVVERLEAVIV